MALIWLVNFYKSTDSTLDLKKAPKRKIMKTVFLNHQLNWDQREILNQDRHRRMIWVEKKFIKLTNEWRKVLKYQMKCQHLDFTTRISSLSLEVDRMISMQKLMPVHKNLNRMMLKPMSLVRNQLHRVLASIKRSYYTSKRNQRQPQIFLISETETKIKYP